MNIVDIAVPEYVEVDVSERLAKVRSIFERENPKGIIVTEDGEYAGVVVGKTAHALPDGGRHQGVGRDEIGPVGRPPRGPP